MASHELSWLDDLSQFVSYFPVFLRGEFNSFLNYKTEDDYFKNSIQIEKRIFRTKSRTLRNKTAYSAAKVRKNILDDEERFAIDGISFEDKFGVIMANNNNWTY
ncbi:MAG: hypothetical protein WA160_10900 [Pseudobdellovibrio sp.]